VASEWYSCALSQTNWEEDVKKGIILAMGLMIGASALLTGCENKADKAAGIPVGPKWKGEPYRLELDAKAAKPNPGGVTLPVIKFTANPDALEKRAILVVRFDSLGELKNEPPMNKMILAPVDISGAEGTLSADYMDSASKGFSTFLGAYCVKGKIKISVALVRSSLTNQTGDAEVDAKRLSDWVPIELVYKNTHPKC
jgi:hypothetical protein